MKAVLEIFSSSPSLWKEITLNGNGNNWNGENFREMWMICLCSSFVLSTL